MQFPIIKKEDQSLALEVPDDLLQQLTSKPLQAEAELQSKKSLVDQVSEWVDTRVIAEMVLDHLKAEGMPVTFDKAKEVWLDTLQMLGSHLAEMAQPKTMDDFSPEEKAKFVIDWGKGLSLEHKAIFAEVVGLPIAKATEAEVAEAEGTKKPRFIWGKTTEPGYKFFDYLNLSVRESQEA